MSDVEKRLSDLESPVWDLPNLIDLRLGRVESSYAEVSGRLSRMERTIAMLQTDLRDLRGGVTRQLVAQDERIRKVEERLGKVEVGLARGEALQAQRFDRLESMLGKVLDKLDAS